MGENKLFLIVIFSKTIIFVIIILNALNWQTTDSHQVIINIGVRPHPTRPA